MEQAIKSNPALLQKVGVVYRFNIAHSGGKAVYTVDVKNAATAGVKKGEVGEASCTISMEDGDFFEMSTGALDAMQAFGMGKIEISGDMMAAQKLSVITKGAKL